VAQWLSRRTCNHQTWVHHSTPTGTYESLLAAGRASGQNCCRAPVKLRPR